MDIAAKLVLALHILALVAGMGTGLSSERVVAQMGQGGEDTRNVLFKILGSLKQIGHIAIVLLWVTGIALIYMRGWDLANMSVYFWIKIALVIVLSGAIGINSSASKKVQAGDASAAKTAEMAGRISALSGVLIIIMAVFAFK